MRWLSYSLYKIGLLLVALTSMFAWMFWYLTVPVIIISFVATTFMLITHPNDFVNKKTLLIPLFILLIFEIYLIRDNELQSFFSAILRTFIIGSVIFLTDARKNEIIHFLTKSIGIILFISMFFWFLFLMGVNLPYTVTDFQKGKYLYENYFFFLYNLKLQVFFVPRFSSIFPEPGNLALITTFLIVANKFNYRKFWVFVLLIATLISFSLAGYVLLLLSSAIYYIGLSNHPVRNFIILGVLVGSFIVFFMNYNDGNNPVKILIFDRLRVEDGDIAGNNRTTFLFKDYFKSFIHKPEVIWGIGSKKYATMTWGGGTAGIKVFIVMHGIIGLLLMLLLYVSYFIQYRSKVGINMLITYFVCYLQNTYPLAEITLIIFITGLAYLKSLHDQQVKQQIAYGT